MAKRYRPWPRNFVLQELRSFFGTLEFFGEENEHEVYSAVAKGDIPTIVALDRDIRRDRVWSVILLGGSIDAKIF